ncbi:MAG TPA: FkbM family methyltransferase [Candidatus Nanoarchaeia archaeon]|nr:FkbM family methyltransferase [Candidatus Nanoarchaeia archaeon]
MTIINRFWNMAKQASIDAFAAYRAMGPRKWFSLWLTWRPEKIVSLNGIKLAIRTRTMKLKLADLCMAVECILFKEYTPEGFEIKKTDTVVDVGGHIGSFSLLAAKNARKVYTFEPSPNNYAQLVKNAKINGFKNMNPINQAVASKKGTLKLYIDPLNTAANSLYQKSDKYVSVKATTLPEFFKKNKITKCDFLKLDCEGAEYDILLNLDAKTLGKIKKIVCEYHEPLSFGIKNPEFTPENVAAHLRKNKFTVLVKKIKTYQGMIYAKK